MKYLFLLVALMLKFSVQAQTVTYFNEKNDTVSVEDSWDYFIEIRQIDSVQNLWVEERVNSDSQMLSLMEFVFDKENKRIREGVSKDWFESGQIKRELNYSENKLHGLIKTYWNNGQLKRFDIFEKDSLLSGKCYDSLANEIEHFPYFISPTFKKGASEMLRFISMNVRYPESDLDNGIQGTVIVEFTVNKDGSLERIKIKEAPSQTLANEGFRVINMMHDMWNPGLIDGEIVRMKMSAPIRFRLFK